MLNNLNKSILADHAAIQNLVAENAACLTKEQELAFMVAGGKERIYLNDLAGKLTGNIINRISDSIVEEEAITVYPDKTYSRVQSLNASLYMVAAYSVLMSGYTSKNIVHSALMQWAEDDRVEPSFKIDYEEVAIKIITQFQLDKILHTEEDTGSLTTGEIFKGFPCTDIIQELRITTMNDLWAKAKPKMKPMYFPLTWNLNGTCELKNLAFKEEVKQDFIDSMNTAGNTAYSVNKAIRAEIKRKLKKGGYEEEQQNEMRSLLQLDVERHLYFPHTPDYRGRLYARGGSTTFQGVKDLRVAFDFAKYEKVEESGLFLHIANAHGYDKASITDRLQWVKDNHLALMTTKSSTLYAERARLAYIEYKTTGETNIVCRIDGTCSGVQITSGLFLDAKTGAAVNVGKSSPDDIPADCYGVVADIAIKLCKRAVDKAILVKYHRDITKKVVMILAYGAGDEKLVDAVTEFLIANKERSSNAKSIKVCIMNAINSEFPAITRLHKDLQIELDDLDLTKLSYQLEDIKVKIKPTNTEHLNLYGTNYSCKLVGKRIPDAAALKRGIAPNFVHSLDSLLLRKAINKMNCDVSAIHDDLGVHSKDVRAALMAVRTSYVEVIKAEPLKELYIAMGIEEEYELEPLGLDLNDVLESAYLFS